MTRYRKNSSKTVLSIVGLLFGVVITVGLALSCSPGPTPMPSPTPLPPATATPAATATPVADLVATPIPVGGRDVTDFAFAVCGDNHNGHEVYTEILRRVEEDGAAFLVNTGDLVDRGRADAFQKFAELMSSFSLPFFPAAGNHDTADGFLDEFVQYSGAPAEHYSFDYGLGHFVVVDSHLRILSDRELAWLEADLAATDQPLKMVFLHLPPFDPDGGDNILRGGNDQFMALMEQYGVSHVFTGHIHAYAEGIRNGVHYFVSGGCGGPIDPDDFYHYLRVTVGGTDVNTEVVKIEAPEWEE